MGLLSALGSGLFNFGLNELSGFLGRQREEGALEKALADLQGFGSTPTVPALASLTGGAVQSPVQPADISQITPAMARFGPIFQAALDIANRPGEQQAEFNKRVMDVIAAQIKEITERGGLGIDRAITEGQFRGTDVLPVDVMQQRIADLTGKKEAAKTVEIQRRKEHATQQDILKKQVPGVGGGVKGGKPLSTSEINTIDKVLRATHPELLGDPDPISLQPTITPEFTEMLRKTIDIKQSRSMNVLEAIDAAMAELQTEEEPQLSLPPAATSATPKKIPVPTKERNKYREGQNVTDTITNRVYKYIQGELILQE